MKNKLQTPQLNPYLLVSPHPSRFSSLLNLGHHFYFWNKTKLYWLQSGTKIIYLPFHNLENAIWKNSLDLFLLWFSWCDHFACQILTGIFVWFTELPQISTTTFDRPESPECFSLSIFFANQTSSTSTLVITFVPQMYIQFSDWFNQLLIDYCDLSFRFIDWFSYYFHLLIDLYSNRLLWWLFRLVCLTFSGLMATYNKLVLPKSRFLQHVAPEQSTNP